MSISGFSRPSPSRRPGPRTAPDCAEPPRHWPKSAPSAAGRWAISRSGSPVTIMPLRLNDVLDNRPMALPPEIEGRWQTGVVLKRDVLSSVERGRFRADGGEDEAVLGRIAGVRGGTYATP